MNSLFHATFSWPSVVVVSFKNSVIFTQEVTNARVNTCCKLKLVFMGKRQINFRADSILKSDGDLVHEPDKP